MSGETHNSKQLKSIDTLPLLSGYEVTASVHGNSLFPPLQL